MSAGADWPWVAMLVLGAVHGLNPGMGWLFAAALGMQEGKGSAAWRALPPLAVGHAVSVAALLLVALAVGFVVPPVALRWTVALLLVGYGLLRLVRAAHPRWGGMRVGARDLAVWSFLMATAHGAGLMVLPFVLPLMPAKGGAAAEAALDALGAHGAHAGHGAQLHGAYGAGSGAEPAPLGEPPLHELPALVDAPLHELPALVDAPLHELPVLVDAPLHAAGAAGSSELVEAAVAVLLHTGAYLLVTGALAVAVTSWLGLRLLRTLWVDLDRIWAAALVLTGVLTLVL